MNMCSFSCCIPSRSEFKQIDSLSSILKVVSEENRLRILCVLRQGTHCICEITDHLNLSQSLISHHVRDLKDAGIVIDEKKGLKVFYSLTEKGKHVTDLIFQIPQKGN